jgi:response regulator NasT
VSFRILIADDETLIRKDLRELLEELGHVVVAEVRDGREALAQAERIKPDVVVLDIVMPGGGPDGIEVARTLAAEYPVIMLTAHSSTDLVLAARDAGVMGYLTKPFRRKDIAPAIELAVTHFLRSSHLTEKVRALQEQVETRRLVDRAKAVLMRVGQLSETDAHRQLQKLSMERNLSLRRVAEVILSSDDG